MRDRWSRKAQAVIRGGPGAGSADLSAVRCPERCVLDAPRGDMGRLDDDQQGVEPFADSFAAFGSDLGPTTQRYSAWCPGVCRCQIVYDECDPRDGFDVAQVKRAAGRQVNAADFDRGVVIADTKPGGNDVGVRVGGNRRWPAQPLIVQGLEFPVTEH